MKSLRHYLMESARTYKYTIKIAGDLDKNFLDMFMHNLSKFDPVKIEDPKTTPIQKDPYGFPELQNESVTIIKAEFKYPANEPMIQQVAQQLGCNINKVRVTTTDYNDSINAESEKLGNEMKAEPLLLQPEMEDNGKQASKDYANQYLDKVVPKRPSIDYMFDAPKTPTSPNNSKEGINTQSPMSKMTPIQKPLTGNARINKGK
jgi:hypothetical protein